MKGLDALVAAATGATAAHRVHRIQALWSDWGELVRYRLDGVETRQVVVKYVQPPTTGGNPRGWNGDVASARKLRSYEVERSFYREHVRTLSAHCRTPRSIATTDRLLVMEDLGAAGFRPLSGGHRLAPPRLQQVVAWLARFHAHTLDRPPSGLWERGSYWHLATRPDEWAAMAAGPLREAAPLLDRRLREAAHSAWLHGDAKVANVCVARDEVALVDFQYVGPGVGLSDLAYLLGSCLDEASLEQHADDWLDRYFVALAAALDDAPLASAVEAAWRPLWPVAWADFERFLAGWAPQHRKRTGYSARQTAKALARL